MELEIELELEKIFAQQEQIVLNISTSKPSQLLIEVLGRRESNLNPRHTGFARQLYNSGIHSIMSTNSRFTSHAQHLIAIPRLSSFMFVHEGGGGFMEYDFRPPPRPIENPNPVFELIQTNNNGEATFTFTLPPESAYWLITIIGVTEDGYAGSASAVISS